MSISVGNDEGLGEDLLEGRPEDQVLAVSSAYTGAAYNNCDLTTVARSVRLSCFGLLVFSRILQSDPVVSLALLWDERRVSSKTPRYLMAR